MASKAPPPISIPSTPLLTSSSSRRQPMRQARTNPVRKNANSKLPAGRLTNGTGLNGQPTPSTQPPSKFYPALTAFTDAVDALPSETIRHFTLLREVDAKAYGPEATLRGLIASAQALPAPEEPYEFDPALETMKQLDDLQRRREELTNVNEVVLLHELEATQAAEIMGGLKTILGHPETRRARCLQIRTQISEILVTLDEKIHVITTAYEALQKHLQRIDHAYSYVQHEIPDLYRLGSTEHWAYKEPVKKGTAAAQARAAERAQREAEERHTAQQFEASNTRSETRREALLRQKAAAAAAAAAHQATAVNEEDEQAPREPNHAQPAKKLHGNSKIRKEQEALASAKRMAEHQSANGGGGLVPATGTTPVVSQQKRRKTTNTTKETPTTTDKVTAPGTTSKGLGSPRAGTPASTSKRGGKSGSGTGAGRGGRSRNLGPAPSPHLPSAGSPIHPIFPGASVTSKLPGPGGDTPDAASTARPSEALPRTAPKSAKKEKEKDKDVIVREDDIVVATSSVRRNSKVAATPEHRGTEVFGRVLEERTFGKEREDVAMGGTGEKGFPEPVMKAPHAPTADAPPEKPASKRKKDLHHSITLAGPDEMQGIETEQQHRKEAAEKKETEKKRKRHDDHPPAHAAVPGTEKEKPSKSHSSSKARPSTSDGLAAAQQTPTTTSKRGGRKRADSSAAALTHVTRAMKTEEPGEEETQVSEGEGAYADAEDDGDADEEEPVYCYCQQVSYGEMVACDAEHCPREWFHLDCLGIQQAPKGKTKWYCNECKENMTRGRRTGSRA